MGYYVNSPDMSKERGEAVMRVLVRTFLTNEPEQVFVGVNCVHGLGEHKVIRWVGTPTDGDEDRADLTVTCVEGWHTTQSGGDLFISTQLVKSERLHEAIHGPVVM